jgi:hypothetical protein
VSFTPNDKVLESLRHRLVGRVITAVDDATPCDEGGICRITTNDGKRFNLCANDLGAWIEETSDANGVFTDLEALCVSISAQIKELPEADDVLDYAKHIEITRDGPKLFLRLFQETYVVDTDSVQNTREQKILRHESAPGFLGLVVVSGPHALTAWFDKNSWYTEDNPGLIPEELMVDTDVDA